MANCELTVALDRPDAVLVPGDRLTGHVSVRVDAECRCDGLTVRPRWRTRGKGNPDSGHGEVATLFTGTWAAGESRSFPFDLPVPPGPISYAGQLLQVEWSAHAAADIPWAIDPAADAPFILAPGADTESLSLGPGERPAAGDFQRIQRAQRWIFRTGLFGLALAALLVVGAVLVPNRNLRGPMLACSAPLTILSLLIAGVMVRRVAAEQRLGPVELAVEPATARGGDPVRVRLRFRPRRDVEIESATAKLDGREFVVAGAGKNARSFHVALHESQASLQPPRRAAAGKWVELETTLRLPDKAPSSFASNSNHVRWKVELEVKIAGWPDWCQFHPITVRP